MTNQAMREWITKQRELLWESGISENELQARLISRAARDFNAGAFSDEDLIYITRMIVT